MSLRFRVAMWAVVLIGVLPSLASGIGLSTYFRFESLCAAERATVSVGELRTLARLRAVHRSGRIGVVVAGGLVAIYAAGWARRRSRSVRVAVLLGAALLVAAILATSWSGSSWPWHALEPTLAVENTLVVPSDERGGPAYCTEHLDEVARLRSLYALHFAGGIFACLLALGLAELAARSRSN